MRYRITLKWIGPTWPKKWSGRATYVIEMASVDTVEKAIAAAVLLAPRREHNIDESHHWKAIEAWIAVALPENEEADDES